MSLNTNPVVGPRVVRPDVASPFLTDGPKTHVDTRTGAISRWTWTGSLYEAELMQITATQMGATDIELNNLKTGDYEVVATFPWDQNGYPMGIGAPIVSYFELEQNTVQRSLLESPIAQGRFSFAQMAAIQFYVQQYQTGAQPGQGQNQTYTGGTDAFSLFNAWVAFVSGTTANGITGVAGGTIDCGTLFKAIAAKGLQAYDDYEYVFRRTIVGATAAQINFAHHGEKQIWTTDEVTAWEGIPSNGIFQLPVLKLWYKSFGSVHAVAHQKTMVVYTYTQKEVQNVSSIVYQAYGTAVLSDLPPPPPPGP